MDVISVARCLADVLPVNELNDAQLSELLAQAKIRHFERDEVIYHRGDPARDLHVVVEGSVNSTRSPRVDALRGRTHDRARAYSRNNRFPRPGG
jgi:signal-transduction protein with cAMP-binding, CBS, and nucleotidyltransferase domain